MNFVSHGFGGFAARSLQHFALLVVPVLAIGLATANQASATATCSTSSLTLLSAQLITGSGGGVGCTANPTPGLTFYTTAPINSVLSETNVPTFEATWTVAYNGPSPASTTVAYDVIIAGASGQPVTWALEVQTPSSGLAPIAGGLFDIGQSGSTEFRDSQSVGGIIAGNYTFILEATSTGSFSVDAPANTSIDVANPNASGVPEPASVATLGIGLAAGYLFVRRRSRN